MSFSRASDLKRHMLTHSGEQKPHNCEMCNKAFSHKGDLKKHQLTHSSEKSHTCDLCNKAFTLAVCWSVRPFFSHSVVERRVV